MKTILSVIFALFCITITSTAAVGDWKVYMAYSEPQNIQETGNYLFVQASNSLYLYNKGDQSIQTFDKTTGMNDVVITHISWNKNAKRLVIVYDNSNIDLIDIQGNVTNVSDLYNKSMTEDKTANSITNDGKFAYIATNFGGIKLDVSAAEISESYLLGDKIRRFAVSGNNIYALNSENKALTAPLNANLQDKANWTTAATYPAGIFNEDKSAWDNNIELIKTLQPGGPKYNYFGYMKYENGRLYSVNGINSYLQKATFQELNGDNWIVYEDDNIKTKTGVNHEDYKCFDIDPKNPDHVFIGARNGLYEYTNGKFVNFFNDKNGAPFERSTNDNNIEYEIIGGVIFDKDNNLWCLNCLAMKNNIHILDNKRKWYSIQEKELNKMSSGRTLSTLSNMIFDNDGYLWFVNYDWALPAIYRYDTNNNNITCFESFTNQDNVKLTINNGISCIAQDRNGDMWVGTTSCPLLLRKENFDNPNTTFEQVKVPRNDGTNLADYLLNGIWVTSIVIDKANRKWIGTNDNGLYLISSDNIEEIHHFTSDNSFLLSNNIMSLAMDETSGILYIGTERGLCSYSSDVTTDYEEMTSDNMYAYPNPVTPEYNGMITVVGLSYNADVKVLSSNGSIVAEGKSNGGSFTWDGKNKKGEKVASGVYMVVSATENGEKGAVCKISIIR